MSDDAPDALRLAILAVPARADRPMTAEEVAEELGRLALPAAGIGGPSERERGH